MYGFRIGGLAHPSPLLQRVPSSWPLITVLLGESQGADETTISEIRATIALVSGGHILIDRATRTATFCTDGLSDDELIHPLFVPVASVMTSWGLGHAVHGGAFVVDNQAWVVFGERLAGKSTLLARLAAQDFPVLSDDLVAIRDESVLVGPRCIDLREDIPGAASGVGSETSGRTRRRIQLPPAATHVNLGGWIFLEWSSRSSVARLGPTEKLSRLAEMGFTPGPEILGFAERPALLCRRSKADHDPSWIQELIEAARR
jgi:hypothetical protein